MADMPERRFFESGFPTRLPARRAGLPLRFVGVILTALASLSGCTSYVDPKIFVTGVSLGESTDEAMVLRFAVDLNNPNKEPIQLLEFDYEVSIDGVKAYSGKRSARQTLAGNSERQTELPGVISFDVVGWSPAGIPSTVKYEIEGKLQYLTPGEFAQVLLDTGFRRPHSDFRQSGLVQMSNP